MSTPAHRANARLRNMPPCPECNAFRGCACTTEKGIVCAPHRVRERIASGDIFVIAAIVARASHKLRIVQRLAARELP